MSDLIHSEIIFKDFESARRARNIIGDILTDKPDAHISVSDMKMNLSGDFNEKYFILAGVDSEIDKEFYWDKKNIKIYEKEVDGKVYYTFEDPKAPDVV